MRNQWKVLLFVIWMFVGLTGCATATDSEPPPQSALHPASPIAQQHLDLIQLSFWIMMFVLIVVFAIFTYVLIRYRKRRGQEDVIPKQVEGNNWLELTWIVIPAVLIAILAVPTVAQTFEFANLAASEDSLNIKVTGKQFWWEFEYPEYGLVTANELVIPVGQEVSLELTSTDVVHSFWVPRLAGKMDTNPGQVTRMPLFADEPGVYSGTCAELCGAGHALMGFQVIAVLEEEFEQWVAQMQNPVTEPANSLAADGEALFAQNCSSCHAIAGTQFQGTGGPDLSAFGQRLTIGAGMLENTDENLSQWITNSPAIKPGIAMPSFGDLQPSEIEALVAYLKGLE